jgi:A/G-specific adenine glycosylase
MGESAFLLKKPLLKTPFSEALLAFFDQHQRPLPWRTPMRDPYATWVSETMLQQTTVQTVIPYYERFMQRWPTVGDLAVAPLEDVLHAWQGLGYYTRARSLHRAAQIIQELYGGVFPKTLEALQKIPGIGPYTAAAIRTIAFNERAVAIDGNIKRVFTRLFRLPNDAALKQRIEAHTPPTVPGERWGDYTEALMDLGATVCRPQKPICSRCPLNLMCEAHLHGQEALYPAKIVKKPPPTRFGHFFFIERHDGALWMAQESSRLLKGLWRPLRSEFQEELTAPEFPLPAAWKEIKSPLRHTFTHFRLELNLWHTKLAAASTRNPSSPGRWILPQELSEIALSTLTKKGLHLYRSNLT